MVERDEMVMNDVQRLKKLNLLENIGWFIKKNPKKALITSISLFIVIIFILSIPGIIAFAQKNSAEKYIAESELRLDETSLKLSNINVRLETYAEIYKDLNDYKLNLSAQYDKQEILSVKLNQIKKQFEDKEIKKVLYQFKKDKKEKRTLFTDELLELEYNISILDVDTLDVVNINNYLFSQYELFINYKNSIEEIINIRYEKLEIINNKAKTVSVKNKANKYFTSITENKKTFLIGLDKLQTYTKSEIGKYNLKDLKDIQGKYFHQTSLMDNTNDSITVFNDYWTELNTQYYTIVTGHSSSKSKDYVTEPNPAYREWTEIETYTDTETYTEREYVGSRVVGDSREDIYNTVIKTRPVTKTRTVYKNNGLPRTISVPYDVYSFYYTIEKHTPNGVNTSTEYVGKKHGKYDSFISTWDYKTDEKVGYIVWKQLWNDNDGILKGEKISPVIE